MPAFGRAVATSLVLVWLGCLNRFNNWYYEVSPQGGAAIRDPRRAWLAS
jgi:hypothetical protein